MKQRKGLRKLRLNRRFHSISVFLFGTAAVYIQQHHVPNSQYYTELRWKLSMIINGSSLERVFASGH